MKEELPRIFCADALSRSNALSWIGRKSKILEHGLKIVMVNARWSCTNEARHKRWGEVPNELIFLS